MMKQLNYRIHGEKTDVILIHGLFGNMDNLSPVARGLNDEYGTLSVDLRNHGRSFHDASMTYPEMARDVLSLMDSLAIEKAVLLGHSMGGKVAMQIAVQAPERVKGLVVGDIAPINYPPRHENVLQAIQAYNSEQASTRVEADQQLAEFIDEPVVRQLLIKGMMKNSHGCFVWRMNVEGIIDSYKSICAAPDLEEKSYAGPTLFVKGGDSDYLRVEDKTTIARHFPLADLRVITGAGHWLHAEKPALFNTTVKRFMVSL